MSKKRSNESDEESQPFVSAKKVMFSQIAQRRAGHFARPDAEDQTTSSSSTSTTSRKTPNTKTKVSSTPTGVQLMAASNDNSDMEKEAWCGPFSTANEIARNRDEARKQREEHLQRLAEDGYTSIDDIDEYDQLIRDIKASYSESSSGSIATKTFNPSSLVEICLERIIQSLVDESEGFARENIKNMSSDVKVCIAEGLAKKRKLTIESILLLISDDGEEEILLPDCSSLDPQDMLQILMHVMKPSKSFQNTKSKSSGLEDNIYWSQESTDKGIPRPILQRIDLKYCGHCVTDDVLVALRKTGCESNAIELSRSVSSMRPDETEMSSFVSLRLHGLYRVTENAMASLLNSCRGSLLSLDIACAHNYNMLNNIGRLKALRELVLDNISNITDQDISGLYADESLSKLESLSIAGLNQITDDGFIPLISYFGPRLKSLNIRGCVLLGESSVKAMAKSAQSLSELDIGGLSRISSKVWTDIFIGSKSDISEAPIDSSVVMSEDATDSVEEIVALPLGSLCRIGLTELMISDEALVTLFERAGGLLTHLDISACNNITARSFVALSKNCKRNIQYLDMSFVRKVPESIVSELLHSSHSEGLGVSELLVWGCSQLSGRIFQDAAKLNINVVGRMPGLA